MKQWGIRGRVMFLALVPSVLILLALVVYFTYERIAEVDKALAQRGVLVARQLAPGAEFAIFSGDRATLQRLADAALRESDVSAVTIADRQNVELARSESRRELGAEESIRFTESVYQTQLVATDFPQSPSARGTPLKIGEISVTMSRAGAHTQQRKLLLIGLALGMTGLLVAIGLALSIGNSIIGPTRKLAVAMVDLGNTGQVAPLPADGGGEFHTLNTGFNLMAARLRASTDELEARIKFATSEVTAQKDRAERATKAKERFIAAASHDLRQPLHAIGLFAATLQRRAHGTSLQPVTDDLAKAVAVMDRQFESLLDISGLESGTLRAYPKAFPLYRLFAQLAAENAGAAEQKQLRLHVSPTTAVVITDELLLHRILTNLVANAIRYTSKGTVMICARRCDREVQVEVRDSGIGIPDEKQREIFQEFYQVDGAARDRSIGLGLGLAIVSGLARLLATEVKVRSAPGCGSTFFLRLHRGERDGPAASPLPVQTEFSWPDWSALPIIIIDDDPLVLAGNRALLQDLGCNVTTVQDLEGAKAAVSALGNQPVLVLCDFWLSDTQNGIDLLRRLSDLTHAPVFGILVSGDTRPETVDAAKVAGYPLLHKPVSPARLRAVITQIALDMHRSPQNGRPDENTPR